MDSKIFGSFLLFVISSCFVCGSPVGNNSNGEIPNSDALTTPLPSKDPIIQTPGTPKFSPNATEIQSKNTTINNEKPSILPHETISAKNSSVDAKSTMNDTVLVNTKPPGSAVTEQVIAESTNTKMTASTPTSTTAAPATATAAAAAATTTTTTSTTTTTAAAVTTIPTTSSPIMTSPASAVSPTSVKSEKMDNDSEFDGPSFIGGIVLAFGLTGIGFVAYKFYKSRIDLSYRHF